jgi:hypothetical protein
MRPTDLDPTAGEKARVTRLRPGVAHRVTDPTDPRYGRLPAQTRELGGHVGRAADPTQPRELGGRVGGVVDPTDPACAGRSD